MNKQEALAHVGSIGAADIGGVYTCEDFNAHKALARTVREQEGEIARFSSVWGICREHYCSTTSKDCPYCRAEALQQERDEARTLMKEFQRLSSEWEAAHDAMEKERDELDVKYACALSEQNRLKWELDRAYKTTAENYKEYAGRVDEVIAERDELREQLNMIRNANVLADEEKHSLRERLKVMESNWRTENEAAGYWLRQYNEISDRLKAYEAWDDNDKTCGELSCNECNDRFLRLKERLKAADECINAISNDEYTALGTAADNAILKYGERQ